jgi:hypothetical protein
VEKLISAGSIDQLAPAFERCDVELKDAREDAEQAKTLLKKKPAKRTAGEAGAAEPKRSRKQDAEEGSAAGSA